MFFSFRITPSNDRVVLASGNSWLRGVSLKEYKIKIKKKNEKDKKENKNEGNENKSILEDFNCTIGKIIVDNGLEDLWTR